MKYEIQNTTFVKSGLDVIKNSGLLNEKNCNKLFDAKKTITEGWKQTKIWRTGIEMRTSVLNDTRFPTKGMKYYQARHEQSVHFSNLMYLIADYEEKLAEKLELECDIEDALEIKNPKRQEIAIRKAKAQMKRVEWNIKEMEKAGHHRVREVTEWDKIMKELDDGSFPKDDYDHIQKVGLTERWARELESEKQSGKASGNRIGVLSGSLNAMNKHGN